MFADLVELMGAVFDPQGVVHDWQTLIAGCLAIIAAFIGGYYVHRQTASAHRIAIETRQRQFAAARAALPLTLSALSDYARRSASALKEILAQAAGERIPRNATLPVLPNLPQGMVNDLLELVRFGDAAVYETVATVLGEVQLQTARMGQLWREIGLAHVTTTAVNVEEYVLDTATIYAWASALFDFGRRESDGLPDRLNYEEIRSALNLLDFHRIQYERLHATAERRYQRRATREEANNIVM